MSNHYLEPEAQQLADAYEAATKRQWSQPLGYAHSLFEVAIDVLKRAKDIDSPEAIRDAIPQTKLDTIIGHVQWGNGPVKNVAKTPLVGGQWVKGKNHPYDLLVVNNETAPEIPVQVITPVVEHEHPPGAEFATR